MIGLLGAAKYVDAVLEERTIDVVATPFGDLPYERGIVNGVPAVWIRRFGWNDHLPSHKVNHRANIMAFRQLGIRRAFTLNGFGGVNPEFSVGDLVVAHDYIKFLERNPPTILEGVGWARVDLGSDVGGPYCPEIRAALVQAASDATGRTVRDRAVNACVQGPHLETEAEIEMFRRIGADMISTTIWPELVYARELGICFASMAWISDMAGTLSAKSWFMLPPEEVAAVVRAAVVLIPDEARCECQAHGAEEVERQKYGYWMEPGESLP